MADYYLLQTSAAQTASTIFYLTLLFIFLTAIITTIATKRARDKCLKLFRGYHVTVERARGQTLWGRLKVLASGIEVVYDHPYVDPRGREKRSFMVYQPELDVQVHAILRYHDELDERSRSQRLRQIGRTFNPGFFRRAWRGIRNAANTLRDAVAQAIGAAVAQYQRTSPPNAVLASQGTAVSAIGQTLLGRFANAYEPLLEQYLGQPVILDVADPLDPNNAAVEYAGYLADYTQQFIAVFNVEHATTERWEIRLPDADSGPPLPPLPPPPPAGAAAAPLPPPIAQERDLAIRLDGPRLKIQNTGHEILIVRRLERQGHEPLDFGMALPRRATLDLPAQDARGGTLVVEVVRCLDVVAPRRLATVRHAGQLLPRRGLADEFQLDRLPLVAKLFREE